MEVTIKEQTDTYAFFILKRYDKDKQSNPFVYWIGLRYNTCGIHTSGLSGMTTAFLKAFMHLAHQVTSAERGMVVDTALNILDTVNVEPDVTQSARFSTLANTILRQAIDRDEAIITNNIITNPAEAPVTNTNFSDLRVVVAIPVPQLGAVYLDQHIRHGVIAREVIQNLHNLARQLVANGQTELGHDDLMAQYEQIV